MAYDFIYQSRQQCRHEQARTILCYGLRQHLCVRGHRGRAGRGAGADRARPARLPGGGPARQGGGRGAGARARGALRDGPVAAAQARADQPRPADLPKEGSHFDLPIALAVLAAMEVLPRDDWPDTRRWASCRWTARSIPSPGYCPPPSRRRARPRPDLPGGPGRGGRLGRSDRRARARPTCSA